MSIVQEQEIVIEVREENGKSWRVPIESNQVLIGRSFHAQVRCDAEDVSRNHAEMFRDPFGRWWVRDLKSLNGLVINDEERKESVLENGDTVKIGDYFTLVFHVSESSVVQPTGIEQKEEDDLGSGFEKEAVKGEYTILEHVAPPKIDNVHVHTLTELGKRLSNTGKEDERLRLLCRTLVRKDFHAYSAMVLRMSKHDRRCPPEIRASQAARGWSITKDYVSRGLIRAVRKTNSPVMASNVSNNQGELEISLAPEQTKMAAIACPMSESKRWFDFLYVILPPSYGTAQWLAVVALAVKQWEQGESYWTERERAQEHAALEQDVVSARKIQKRAVPRKHIETDELEVAFEFRPCKWVGGDFFDIVPMNDGRMLVCTATVNGNALPAALVVMRLQAIVRSHVRSGQPLHDMMRHINDQLREDEKNPPIVRMVCVAIDPATGEFECTNADHPPAMIIGPDQVRSARSAPEVALGLEQSQWPSEADHVERGEFLALFTDGLINLTDEAGHPLSSHGVCEHIGNILAETPGIDASRSVKKFRAMLDHVEGGRARREDQTLVLIKRKA